MLKRCIRGLDRHRKHTGAAGLWDDNDVGQSFVDPGWSQRRQFHQYTRQWMPQRAHQTQGQDVSGVPPPGPASLFPLTSCRYTSSVEETSTCVPERVNRDEKDVSRYLVCSVHEVDNAVGIGGSDDLEEVAGVDWRGQQRHSRPPSQRGCGCGCDNRAEELGPALMELAHARH